MRRAALRSMRRLLPRMQLSAYASAVLHPLLRVVDGPHDELRRDAMDAICAVAVAFGPDFGIFVPALRKAAARHRLQHEWFERLTRKVAASEPPCMSDAADWEASSSGWAAELELLGEGRAAAPPLPPLDAGGAAKLPVNALVLRRAWESSQRVTKDDWAEWLRNFSVELLRESPSPALRACHGLAQMHPNMARELFAAGFVSCWSELDAGLQEQLVRSLEAALAAPTIPPETVTALLNLAEFMEHDDKRLPLDTRTLGALAEKCHAFAKALHYKEADFAAAPTAAIEALIHINNQLRQPEAAVGVLTYAQKHLNMELKESWCARARARGAACWGGGQLGPRRRPALPPFFSAPLTAARHPRPRTAQVREAAALGRRAGRVRAAAEPRGAGQHGAPLGHAGAFAPAPGCRLLLAAPPRIPPPAGSLALSADHLLPCCAPRAPPPPNQRAGTHALPGGAGRVGVALHAVPHRVVQERAAHAARDGAHRGARGVADGVLGRDGGVRGRGGRGRGGAGGDGDGRLPALRAVRAAQPVRRGAHARGARARADEHRAGGAGGRVVRARLHRHDPRAAAGGAGGGHRVQARGGGARWRRQRQQPLAAAQRRRGRRDRRHRAHRLHQAAVDGPAEGGAEECGGARRGCAGLRQEGGEGCSRSRCPAYGFCWGPKY